MNTYGDIATLVQAPLVDGYGGARVRDWSAATQGIIPCAVQPRAGTEDVHGRQTTTTDKTLHCGPGANVRAVDRVVWAGLPFEVDGEPELHLMLGRPDHLEVPLRRVAEVDA